MKKPELKVWWWESKEGIKMEAHCTGRADGRLRINRRSRFTAKMNRDLRAFPRWQDMLALGTGLRWNMGLQSWESLGEESPLGPLTDRQVMGEGAGMGMKLLLHNGTPNYRQTCVSPYSPQLPRYLSVYILFPQDQKLPERMPSDPTEPMAYKPYSTHGHTA